jgi:YggT family protein
VILFANFLGAFADIIHVVLRLYMWIVIFRAILSWIRVPALYPVSVILYYLTEPVLRPLRRFFPPNKMGGIDITPILAILLIWFVDRLIVVTLADYAHQLREHALTISPALSLKSAGKASS